MAEQDNAVIKASNLSVGYGSFIVLKNLNFQINRKEIFFILGGSGCGKSTLLKHMIGLYPPSTGDILIKGQNIAAASEDEMKKISLQFGVLYQSGALFSSLTLEENIALPLKEFTNLSVEEISAVARMKLSLVGLSGFESFLPGEISGGMKKRAGLARALALDPEIVFFDEPSAGLDPISSAELDRLILDLRNSLNCTMVIVSHELDSIFSVGDRVIILDKKVKGIVAEGDPRVLRENTDNKWVKELLTRSNMRGK